MKPLPESPSHSPSIRLHPSTSHFRKPHNWGWFSIVFSMIPALMGIWWNMNPHSSISCEWTAIARAGGMFIVEYQARVSTVWTCLCLKPFIMSCCLMDLLCHFDGKCTQDYPWVLLAVLLSHRFLIVFLTNHPWCRSCRRNARGLICMYAVAWQHRQFAGCINGCKWTSKDISINTYIYIYVC